MKLPIPKRELKHAIWLMLLGALIGWLLEHVLLGVLAGSLACLLIHLNQLKQLENWAEDTSQPVPDGMGTWAKAYSAIHHLYRNERKSKESLISIIDRARSSIAALDEGIALIDKDGNLEWWNPSAGKLLGLRARDMQQPLINIIRAPAFIRYFQHGPFNEGIKLPSHKHAGRHLQFEITLFGDNDKLMIVYDITRVHKLEQMRKDFVANVSHELRTPLTVLSGYLETFLAQAESLSPRMLKALQQMDGQTLRMKNLVNDLLLLSSLENEGLQVKLSPVDVPRLLQQVLHDAQVLAEPKHQTINLNADESILIMGMSSNLRSAFSNLVTNAIKYTPDGGKVDIFWGRHESGDVTFSVTDSGIGIDATHIPRLTERFYRVDAGRSSATGGTGLGLAIVKHVLMQHSAHLTIESQPGLGSTFSCHFPRALITR